jgi:enoyl-CoA hydratase/carnithine racemase
MQPSMIQVEHRDNTAIAKLNRSITNALNLNLLNELAEILKKVRKDSTTHSLILTSTNEKFFSIGFDIPELFGLSRADFKVFYKTFNRVCLDLYTIPKLTSAAINGHAVAGGCILALCCDYRIIAEGKKKMGLNEIKLGVPIPYPADRILHQIVGFRNAREIVDTGDFYLPDKLLGMGIVDHIVPQDYVLEKAIEKARSTDERIDAFAMIKQNRIEDVEAEILAKLKEKEQIFLNLWYAPVTRRRLEAAMEKF